MIQYKYELEEMAVLVAGRGDWGRDRTCICRIDNILSKFSVVTSQHGTHEDHSLHSNRNPIDPSHLLDVFSTGCMVE